MIALPLALEIEIYLMNNPRWVPVSEICEVFGINERDLRATSKRRPICERFAISCPTPGRNGFKHIQHATITERLAYKHRCMRNLVAYARARKAYEQALQTATDTRIPKTDLTGQTILPL